MMIQGESNQKKFDVFKSLFRQSKLLGFTPEEKELMNWKQAV